MLREEEATLHTETPFVRPSEASKEVELMVPASRSGKTASISRG
jgi:hypothetical protein